MFRFSASTLAYGKLLMSLVRMLLNSMLPSTNCGAYLFTRPVRTDGLRRICRATRSTRINASIPMTTFLSIFQPFFAIA